jgi:tetratricopeptide (TPR) repeat protein
MKSVRHIILFAICTGVFVVLSQAQPREQEPKPSSKGKDAVIRRADIVRTNATSLLYALAQGGNEIGSVFERVLVMAEVADALWPVDQDSARRILVRDFQEIDKLSAGPDSNSALVASQRRTLRRIVLSRIARHDPALASQLINNLPKEPPTADERARQRDGAATPNGEALLGLAQNLLSTDTKKAALLALASLPDGLSQRLRLFLNGLRAKDPGAADVVVDAALKQASTEHPGRLFDVMMLWDYVYQPKNFYLNGISWEREADEVRSGPSPVLQKRVLQFAVTAIMENLQQLPATLESESDRRLSQQQAGSIYSVIQQLLPNMQSDWPQGAVDLQQALARVQRDLQTIGQKPPERPENNEKSDSEGSLVEKLLEKASSASMGEGRDSLYLGASFKLLQLGKYEQAKTVAAKIDDLDRRQTILEPINFKLALELAEKGSLNEALTIVPQLKTPELRIDVLARVGNAFLAKGDAPSGFDAFTSAQSAASKAEPSVEIVAATLRVASGVLKNDSSRAAELIGLAIQIANKVKDDQSPWPLISPASNDPLSFTWKNSDGQGLQSVKTSYGRNGGLPALLSKLEFEEAVALAKNIKLKALSLAVQAAVCRAAIESTQVKTAAAQL